MGNPGGDSRPDQGEKKQGGFLGQEGGQVEKARPPALARPVSGRGQEGQAQEKETKRIVVEAQDDEIFRPGRVEGKKQSGAERFPLSQFQASAQAENDEGIGAQEQKAQEPSRHGVEAGQGISGKVSQGGDRPIAGLAGAREITGGKQGRQVSQVLAEAVVDQVSPVIVGQGSVQAAGIEEGKKSQKDQGERDVPGLSLHFSVSSRARKGESRPLNISLIFSLVRP